MIIDRVLPGIDSTPLGSVRGHEDGVVTHVCHYKKLKVNLALCHPLAIQSYELRASVLGQGGERALLSMGNTSYTEL